MTKPTMIGETAGRRFARELSALLNDVQSYGVDERALLECMLGYAVGRLMGNGATRDDVRALLGGVIDNLPQGPFSAGGEG